MHRSSSWSRNSDEYYMQSPPRASKLLRMVSSSVEVNELPTYDPIVENAKKEKLNSKFAENAVHLIPLVLFICGFILWFFSNPDVEVGLGSKGDSIASRIEGLTIDGEIDTESDGTQSSFLAADVDESTKPLKNDAGTARKLIMWPLD